MLSLIREHSGICEQDVAKVSKAKSCQIKRNHIEIKEFYFIPGLAMEQRNNGPH